MRFAQARQNFATARARKARALSRNTLFAVLTMLSSTTAFADDQASGRVGLPPLDDAPNAVSPPGLPDLPPPQSSGQSTAEISNAVVSDSVVLGSRTFGIPFNVDDADKNELETRPVEVHLYYSRGPGTAWQMVDRKPPSVSEFQFQCDSDGPFWFATRTLDAAGRPHPSGELEPQLKVYVDTEKPLVQLTAQADASGKVVATIQATDATPVKTVEMFYVTDTIRKWRRLDSRAIKIDSKVTFAPKEDWRQLSVQAIVADSAGNQSVQSQIVQRPRVAVIPTRTYAQQNSPKSDSQIEAKTVAGPADPPQLQFNLPPSSLSPVEGTPAAEVIPPGLYPQGLASQVTATPELKSNTQRPVPETIPVPKTAAVENGVPSSPTTDTSTEPRSRTLAEAFRPIEDKSNTSTQRDQTSENPQSLPLGGRPAQPTTGGYSAGLENIPAPTPEVDPAPPSENISPKPPEKAERSEEIERQKLRDAQRVQAYEANRAKQAEFDRAAMLDRISVRYSDSQRFSLEYELEAVGSSGVDAIELYGSTDLGKTWKRWGSDPDRVSPFDIETNEEGVFCFRIVVIGSNGLTSPRPLAGEEPDIAVVVDKSAPNVKITSAKYGTGDRAGALVIGYECDDPNLMNRPIALSFSRTIEGPWSTIAAGLRNDGLHAWPADPQLPRKIYLRIDATDQSGNIGTYILQQPIDTQGLAPRARILGFQVR